MKILPNKCFAFGTGHAVHRVWGATVQARELSRYLLPENERMLEQGPSQEAKLPRPV